MTYTASPHRGSAASPCSADCARDCWSRTTCATSTSVFELSNEPRALLSGAALIWLIGVLDDKFEIDALIKLGAQMISAGVMVMQGLTILWMPVPGIGTVALTQWQGKLLTVALVVITVNAVNFVDGLDGLAAGMVCIASAAFFLYSYRIWFGKRPRGGHPRGPVHRDPHGHVPRLPPAQLQPGPHLHGGLRIDAHRSGAGRRRDLVTGKVDPDTMALFVGGERNTVHWR